MLTCCAAAALPTFDIAEGALDKVLELYKAALPGLGGYLTHAGELHLGRLEALVASIAALEQQVLEERAAVSRPPPLGTQSLAAPKFCSHKRAAYFCATCRPCLLLLCWRHEGYWRPGVGKCLRRLAQGLADSTTGLNALQHLLLLELSAPHQAPLGARTCDSAQGTSAGLLRSLPACQPAHAAPHGCVVQNPLHLP